MLRLFVWLLGGVLLLGLIEYRRRQRAYWHGPHYVEQIARLKADRPLALPAIKPLKAVTVPKAPPLALVPRDDAWRRVG